MAVPPGSCESCGKAGLMYAHQGRYYCPACLAKKRPPLDYPGPERRQRREAKRIGFKRRRSDPSGVKN